MWGSNEINSSAKIKKMASSKRLRMTLRKAQPKNVYISVTPKFKTEYDLHRQRS